MTRHEWHLVGSALALAATLVLAALLAGCQLGPTGRAAVATQTTLVTLDGACMVYARAYALEQGGRTDAAISACTGKGSAFRACVDAQLGPHNRALAACEVYGHARRGAARALDSDLGGVASEVLAALAVVGVKVQP